MYPINCCMQFVTLQALNRMFTSEKQSHVKEQAFHFYKKHCEWSEMSVAMRLQIT